VKLREKMGGGNEGVTYYIRELLITFVGKQGLPHVLEVFLQQLSYHIGLRRVVELEGTISKFEKRGMRH